MANVVEAKFTPGPWAWFGNVVGNQMYLATTHSGRRYVMGFSRWGMRGAQPRFQVNSRLVPASDLATFEVGDRNVRGVAEAKANDSVYRLDIDGIDCPDARLIASAPDLYEALCMMVEEKADYMRLNNLGDPETQHTIKVSRAALAKASA